MKKLERQIAVAVFLIFVGSGSAMFVMSLGRGLKISPPDNSHVQDMALHNLSQVIGNYHANYGIYPKRLQDLEGSILVLPNGSSCLFNTESHIGRGKEAGAYTIVPQHLAFAGKIPASMLIVAYATASEDGSLVKIRSR